MKTRGTVSIYIISIICLFPIILIAQQSTTGPVPPEGCYRGKIKNFNKAQVIISGVPSYNWQHGCGPTALGMVIGYYDSHGYSDLINGDASTQTINVNNAIANNEHYNDYSLPMDGPPEPPIPDLSELGGAHESNCIGDFMKTSWSITGSYYGNSFFNDIGIAYINYIQMMNCHYLVNTYNHYYSSNSWDTYKEEINNNRPIVLLVDHDGDGITDHFVTGIGYDDTNNEYAIYDTWDNNIHWFDWNGISSGVLWGIYGFIGFEIEAINSITLDLKVYLEGPYNQNIGLMESQLLPNLISYNQPYNIDPWNYNGSEYIISIPNPNIIDWVLIEIRDAMGDASTANNSTCIKRRAGFVLNDGKIVDLDGYSTLLFDNITANNNLYTVVWHRNNIGIISNISLVPNNGVYEYDFSNDQNKAYGGTAAQKELDNGVWGMIAGDFDGNGEVTLTDLTMIWNEETGGKGYLLSDQNLDAQSNNVDKNDYFINNLGIMSMVPGLFGFACGEDLNDLRDGQIYNTVQIGNQCWMKENLNIGTMINGNEEMTDNNTIEKYCYDNEPDSCAKYGGIYQWDEMMQYTTTQGVQGICPPDWHLPTDEEWKQLEGEVDSYYGYPDPEWDGELWRGFDAGLNLKSSGGWYSGGNGTDLYGFTALPGSLRYTDGNFYLITHRAYFWSSSEDNSDLAWARALYYNYNEVGRDNNGKLSGFSVRCLKD